MSIFSLSRIVPVASELRASARERCAVCGSAGAVLHHDVPDHYFGVPGAWTLKRCIQPNCGLIWQDPMIISDDLVRAYLNYYTTAVENSQSSGFSGTGFGSLFFRLERLTTRMLRLQPERLRHGFAYLDDKMPGKLLDVGCGSGSFAAAMRQQGWEVRGTDFDPNAADSARKTHAIHVDIGDLRDIRYDDGAFDAITVRHVVEHVREPVEFATECWRILKPGGRLVFITPNAGSLGHRHFGSRWRGLEQPRHLFLFDCASMTALLSRAGIPAANVFSSAQGSMYVMRESCESSRGTLQRMVDFVAIWWLQFREASLIGRGLQVGEELVATATKPEKQGSE